MAKAGSVEIEITALTAKFRSGIEKANKGLDRLRDKVRAAAKEQYNLKNAVASLAVAGFTAKKFFDLGAAVEETASKFERVFGPSAIMVNDTLAESARLAGLTNQEMQDLAATSGQVAQGMGFSRDASADFAIAVSQLAADLGSFNNIPVAETSRAIQAAITGEREQLKRLGIVVREVDVQQRAMQISGAKNASQLTNQAKAAATMQLIAERAGAAIGDLAATQDSAAAQARTMRSDLFDLRNEIAENLMPALLMGLRGFNAFVQGMRLWAAQLKVNKNIIGQFLADNLLPFIVGEERAAEASARLSEKINESSVALLELEQSIMDSVVPAVDVLTKSSGELAKDLAASVVPVVTFDENAALLNKTLEHQGVTVVPTLVDGIKALTVATGQAADETNRLNSAQNKLSAISSGLGFLGRFIGPVASLASGLGAITSGIGIGETIINAFGGQQARLDTNLSISINGISDGTTQVIRGKLSDFDKRDVPVVL